MWPLPMTVADPGFSPGGCVNSQKCYYFSNFCRKLHENERIWTPGGGGGTRVPGTPPWVHQCMMHLPQRTLPFFLNLAPQDMFKLTKLGPYHAGNPSTHGLVQGHLPRHVQTCPLRSQADAHATEMLTSASSFCSTRLLFSRECSSK